MRKPKKILIDPNFDTRLIKPGCILIQNSKIPDEALIKFGIVLSVSRDRNIFEYDWAEIFCLEDTERKINIEPSYFPVEWKDFFIILP